MVNAWALLDEAKAEVRKLELELAYFRGDLHGEVAAEITVAPHLRLTHQEACLVVALIGAKGRILSRGTLEELLGSRQRTTPEERSDGHVPVVVWKARRKLGKGVIETVHGRGFRIDPANHSQLLRGQA